MTVMTRKKPGRPSKMPPAEELFAYYEDHTAREVAEKYGVSVNTVKTWLRIYRTPPKEVGGQDE